MTDGDPSLHHLQRGAASSAPCPGTRSVSTRVHPRLVQLPVVVEVSGQDGGAKQQNRLGALDAPASAADTQAADEVATGALDESRSGGIVPDQTRPVERGATRSRRSSGCRR